MNINSPRVRTQWPHILHVTNINISRVRIINYAVREKGRVQTINYTSGKRTKGHTYSTSLI